MKYPRTLDECMDVFDWFDDKRFDLIQHILISKVNGNERVKRTLPELRKHAMWLVSVHADTDSAYPTELLNRPA